MRRRVEAERLGRDDLVRAGVRHHRLEVHAGLVRVGGLAGDVVVERHLDAGHPRDEPLELPELAEAVALRDALRLEREHARDEAAERGDAVPLADAEHRHVDVGGAGRDRLVARWRSAQPVSLWPWKPMSQRTALPHLAYEREDLARRGDPDGVGEADPVDAEPLRGAVDGSRSATSVRKASSAQKRTSSPAESASSMGGAIASMICWMRLPVRRLAQDAARREEQPDAAHARVDAPPARRPPRSASG